MVLNGVNVGKPARRLRIAFVDYVLEPEKPGRSGLSDIVWDMASELVNIGHEVHVIASYHTRNYPDDRVIVHNFPTPPMGYRNVIGNFWLLKAVGIAKRIQADVIHAPEYVSTAVFASLGVPTPLVLTVPGNIYHRIANGHSYEWYFVQVLKWAARTSAKRCASTIAVSQEMKRWWELTGSNPNRTPYIPYGVNTERFYHVPNARFILQLPANKLIFLYVGRFAVEKGLLDLVDAVALISPRVNPVEVAFVLIGRGPTRQSIEDKIKSYGLGDVFTLLDRVSQDLLSVWYSAADALILPSHSEAFSRTIIEAMICGTPVIGSAITGTEDHIKGGQTGFLFQPKSPQSLAAVLQQSIVDQNLLHNMRASTFTYAQDNLTWKKIIERINIEVYQHLAAAK